MQDFTGNVKLNLLEGADVKLYKAFQVFSKIFPILYVFYIVNRVLIW